MRELRKNAVPPALFVAAACALFMSRQTREHRPPSSQAVDGLAIGRSYAPVLVRTYADAWDSAARAIEDGKPVAEAQKTLQETWKAARVKAFRDEVEPAFARTLPAGTEPTDAAARSRVAALWRSFAEGLKQGAVAGPTPPAARSRRAPRLDRP